MSYSLLADCTVFLHFAFVLFVVFGGLLVIKWSWVIWIHLPAAVWAAIVEIMGWICPLTPLENRFRRMAGEEGYPSDFLAHYLLPLLYPEGLTREVQIGLGLLVILVNFGVYWLVLRGGNRRP